MCRRTMFLLALVASSSAAFAASTEQVLYNFAGGVDGSHPHSALTYHNGSFYGTTAGGGSSNPNGNVFQLQQVGSTWVETVLYTFAGGKDGSGPFSDVVFDNAGNIYGTTSFGGAYLVGDVYKLTLAGSGYTESVIYTFTGGADGGYPFQEGKLVLDSSGNIYGTTTEGGATNFGTVFRLTPSGSGYTESVLYSFTGSADGGNTNAGLIHRGSSFYGVTYGGGASGYGTVFELTLSKNVWTENVLYSFTGGADGGGPVGGLVFDQTGNLCGTTSGDQGALGYGTVFKLKNSGSGWTETVLYSFAGGNDGQEPSAALVIDPKGNLYGTTVGIPYSGPAHGTVFRLSPSRGGWTETILHDFSGGSDGEFPFGSVVIHGGKLYGMTRGGGIDGWGTIFEVTP